MFKIEKGIPRPKGAGRPRGECPYPFAEMAVGDSFYVPLAGMQLRSLLRRLSLQAALFRERGNNPQFAITCSSEGDGARCWRVEDRDPRARRAPAPKIEIAPQVKVHRLNTPEDDRHDRGGRSSPALKPETRFVKGSRY